MAVALTASMFIMSNGFVKNTFASKSLEITSVNASIATMIMETKSAALSNTIEDIEYHLSSMSDLFLSGDRQGFEDRLLTLYDESFAKYVDIFFFRSVDGKYIFDASSPFYDTSRIVNYMVANGHFLQSGIRTIQSESADGTLVAISGASEAISLNTGELAGYFYAGILLNNSTDLISEILSTARLSEAAIVYGDSIIAGNLKKTPQTVIEACYNQQDIIVEQNEIIRCSDINLGSDGVTLKFFQALPDSFLAEVTMQNKKMVYISIVIVLIVTLISGYAINLVTVNSLYKLVDFTKLVLSGEDRSGYGKSMIYEFNLLANQIEAVSNDLTETQAYMRNLIKNAQAPMAIWDSSGNITLFNHALEKLSGYDSENVVGKHLSHIYNIFPDANVPVAGVSEETSRVSKFESLVRNKETGAERHVLWNLTDVFNEGVYAGTILQGIDISEMKEAESKLMLASKVFENTLEGMAIFDSKGTVLSCNHAFSVITEYRESDIIGADINILRSDRHDDAFYRDIWRNLYKYGRWSGEIWLKKKTEVAFPAIYTISCIRNTAGEITNFVSVVHDITERKSYEDHIRFQATHDGLTGLPNRFLFTQNLAQAISKNDGLTKTAMVFLDIDRFKNLNDTLGHATGDRVLEIISERIRNKLDGDHIAARFSGDEFGLLLTGLETKEEASRLAKNIIEKIAEPIILQGYELFIQMSAGICFYPENGKNASELIKNAEIAMYQAKQKGRNNLQPYTGGLDSILKERLLMESKLNRALENNELTIHYQPKIDLALRKVMGMEALLRWNNPELGNIRPDIFIPLAEDTGLILPIGEWVLKKALEDTLTLHSEGYNHLKIAVNLSLRQFMKKDLVSQVRKSLEKEGAGSVKLELEITESVFSEDINSISKVMKDISDLGVSFAIDDFGTGYSSIGYLKKMPVNALKIDRSYINLIDKDTENESIVSSVILMAKSLGLSVVAEGAENADQIELLKEMGCGIVQGYYFGKPMPLEEFRDFLKNWK